MSRLEHMGSREYKKRFRRRFEGRKAAWYPGLDEQGKERRLNQLFPFLSSDEYQITGDEAKQNCHGLANGCAYFEAPQFPSLHIELPPCSHISVWRRAIALWGFRPNLGLPNKIAVITDDDGYVHHSVLRCEYWWLSKMGPWKYVYHRTIRQMLGGLYGNRVHLFSSL